MNKICTSLEQSQRLIELGIDVNTADMRLLDDNRVVSMEPDNEFDGIYAWSLSALFNYLREIDFFPEIDADKSTVTMNINYYDNEDAELLSLAAVHNIKFKAESFIDAAFDMVCWLLEN